MISSAAPPVKSFLSVVEHQEGYAYGPNVTTRAVGTIKDVYYPTARRLVPAAADLRDAGDAKDTLAHEILEHYGLNTFTSG
ncbi:hypothetical protein [Halomonas sp. PR-M31]|uniref:hypothetical protein n=1 Tax=Halomonas sp. PR-M31 TaxID=1471202 RepID=UPI0012E1EDDC|nr:hypothetical protein [Halomonas sp. PR-M31]